MQRSEFSGTNSQAHGARSYGGSGFFGQLGMVSIFYSLKITGRLAPGAVLLLALFIGCGKTEFPFQPNELYTAGLMRESGEGEPRFIAAEASSMVAKWFGTSDSPSIPNFLLEAGVSDLDMEKVLRCAGPVGRAEDEIERGLFRKHCVSCHGITGDGYGLAASLLAPYPRDFRRGTFKFKSTPSGYKPTREDLIHTLTHGIPGTAMPSFAALEESREFAHDIENLAEYVRYLAIRGEIERKLIAKVVREGLNLSEENAEAQQIAIAVARRWQESEFSKVSVPSPPTMTETELAESIQRGKEWYASELTACVKCHGPDGLGNGLSQDYDEWTKDWTVLAGIDPKHPKDWKEMKRFGGLKPVIDRPRNFAWHAYRGGDDREDLFRRLVLGIEGTPMPPIARAQGGNPGLTDAQIWDVVHYVLSLGRKG
jgi:mono/diheme cytochrome c family protein